MCIRDRERVLGPARLAHGGYRVETTLDLSQQAAAECAVAAGVGLSLIHI